MATNVVTDSRVEHLRAQLPATAATAYFNAGTNGPLPTIVHETIVAAARNELTEGRIVPGVYESHAERNDRIRALAAGIFGADPAEIALTHSTNEGLNIALSGLDWRSGDEVVTTNLEHRGLLAPLGMLAHRRGVTLRFADIGHGAGDILGAIAEHLSPRTRAVVLSHLVWSSGAILPLGEIADVAHQHGALVIVDGAQSAGQIPVDLHTLDIDAYAMSGQKWLCGPEGTGLLFIRRERMTDFRPTYFRYGEMAPTGYILPASGARRYEVGEYYAPAVLGQEAALLWLRDEVGLDWIFDRIAYVGRRCWDGLNDIAGVTVTTPKDRMAGLVCFTVDGMTPQEVMDRLYERGITIRFVAFPPNPSVARVANGWWNTNDEVERLVAAVAEIVAETNA